jgi:putative CocE/NonD family hydrolase
MIRWLAAVGVAVYAVAAPVQEFGYVPLGDGAKLSYTLHRPSATGKFPALLIYNMYDASVVSPTWNQTETGDVTDYLERGYAVIGVNTRGTACSTGTADFLNAKQVGGDGAEVVEWIARQPWSDGNVGMFGHSGSGITQFFVAAFNPPHLKAVIPGAAPDDFYRDLAYPGRLFNYAFLYLWAEDAQPNQERRAAQVHIEAGDRDCGLRLRERPKSTFYWDVHGRPENGPWWAERSVGPIASKIRVPTFIIFGWQDQNVDSRAVFVFDKLAGPRKMLLAEEGHSFYIRSGEVKREKLRFFDHWLKGVANDTMAGHPVTVWLTMKGAVERLPDRVVRLPRAAAGGTPMQLHLGADRRLKTTATADNTSLEYLYPLGSTFAYGGTAYPHVPFPLGSLVFRTEPMANPLTILGTTEARLFLSSTAPETSVQVVLNELDPNGNRTYLQRGYQRVQAGSASGPVEVRVSLNPTGSIIEPGNVLELMVMAPNMAPEPLGQWGFLPLALSRNRVHLGPAHPSSLTVPTWP